MDQSRTIGEDVSRLDNEIGIIYRGTAIAVENVNQHFENLQPKYHESKKWADQVCENQTFLLRNWRNATHLLGSITAYKELGKCIQFPIALPNVKIKGHHINTLRDFFDPDIVEKHASSGEVMSKRFADRSRDLNAVFDSVASDSSKVIEDFQRSMHFSHGDARESADRLMEEIEVLAKKINADYEHILGLPDGQKAISQAAKVAQLHKNNFMPSLVQTNDEIRHLSVQAYERKKQAMEASVHYLQDISVIESTISVIHSKLADLDIENADGQVFDVLDFVVRLPSIYGSLLVECVKRHEWAKKITADLSSIVEEVATYKDEEARRRKRWAKDMADTLDLGSFDDMALDVNISVQSRKEVWPEISRTNISELVECLKEHGDFEGTALEIEKLLESLDTPSKRQSRRVKAFKNGSIHAATLERSLLLRGDDDVLLLLKNEKSKVDEKLKSAESRVRKLEDLLHRQSQSSPFSTPTSAAGPPGSNPPLFERHTTAPTTNFSSALTKAREVGSRRSSTSSRRFSMNQESDEKGLAQRIVDLEADLTKEKAHSADLVKKAAAQSDAEDLLKSRIKEAISTKEDLFGNFEAQQREFDDERRLLHEENSKIRIQLEQLEDEFDRVVENHEQEEKIHLLEEELDQVKKDAANEIENAHQQIKTLSVDCASQKSRMEGMDQEARQQREETVRLTLEVDRLNLHVRNNDQAQADHHRALRTALLHLSHDNDIPQDFGALTSAVEAIAEKSAAHLNAIKDSVDSLRADNAALDMRIKGQDDEIYDLRENLGSEERKVFSLHEELSTYKSRSASLQAQLEFEQHEHEQAQANLAAGETNTNALRSQLAEKEDVSAQALGQVAQHEIKLQDLSSMLAQREAGLADWQRMHDDLENARKAYAPKTVELSRRLYSQRLIMERLLEQIGLVIVREDDKMVIQKAPKATNASTILSDGSVSMKRSLSGPLFSENDQYELIESKILHWADAEDVAEIEERFSEFAREVLTFDTNVFGEAVHKRVKDIEHIARKWQKEARAYRDRSHRAQGEAHDRIALRNFKEGDLALFLPTRDQATKPWAAFNVGAPHCFLREQDSHNLRKRDWLIARISKVEERVVDLSKSINGGLQGSGDQKSGGDKSGTGAFPNDENPYELSDGLRWYLIDAAEEKPGAPINVGTGKVTVASANVDAKGSIRMKKAADGQGATKTLTRSLDSRRSSTNSKKGLVAMTSNPLAGPSSSSFDGMVEQSIDNAAAAAAASTNLHITKDAPQAEEEARPQSDQTLDPPIPTGQGNEHVGKSSI